MIISIWFFLSLFSLTLESTSITFMRSGSFSSFVHRFIECSLSKETSSLFRLLIFNFVSFCWFCSYSFCLYFSCLLTLSFFFPQTFWYSSWSLCYWSYIWNQTFLLEIIKYFTFFIFIVSFWWAPLLFY